MKTKLVTLLVFLALTIMGTAQNNSQLVGTWKLVSGKMSNGDSTTTYDMKTIESMKIVTPTHFAVFEKSTTTGDVEHAGAGPVSSDDKTYTETIMYATGTGNKYPMIAKFTYELNGDQWHIKGGFDKLVFDETWQRVK